MPRLTAAAAPVFKNLPFDNRLSLFLIDLEELGSERALFPSTEFQLDFNRPCGIPAAHFSEGPASAQFCQGYIDIAGHRIA